MGGGQKGRFRILLLCVNREAIGAEPRLFARVRVSSFTGIPVQEETVIYVTPSSWKLSLQSFKRPIVKKLKPSTHGRGAYASRPAAGRLGVVLRGRARSPAFSAIALGLCSNPLQRFV
jgi:hypothetical protein